MQYLRVVFNSPSPRAHYELGRPRGWGVCSTEAAQPTLWSFSTRIWQPVPPTCTTMTAIRLYFILFFGRVMPDEGFSRFGLFVKKGEKTKNKKRPTGIISICVLRTTCQNLIKNTYDLRCVCANRCTHQFRSNLLSSYISCFCWRQNTDHIQPKDTRKQLCRARYNHEINAFRERSWRIMYVRTSSYVVRSKTCSGILL